MAKVWLTTNDNPYDPFKAPDKWIDFDMKKGYNTNAIIARLLPTLTNNLTPSEYEEIVRDIIMRIANNDIMDKYKIVTDE